MNYRHHFHAGNFADVFKHALLVQLVRALQHKAKGFLYLDTHAGRGSYDLAVAAQGDSLARRPEWPDGIGRIWSAAASTVAAGNAASGSQADSVAAEYVGLVRGFDAQQGGVAAVPRYYPGSPWIVRALARPQDRLALCEQHPEEYALLAAGLAGEPGVSVHPMDGYTAVRAMLPPPERRALVLIDPPYEQQDELRDVAGALREGRARLAGGVFCVWYPLTDRVAVADFLDELHAERAAPTLRVELTVAGAGTPLKLRGCGLIVVNPPWRFDALAGEAVRWLAPRLAQAPGAAGHVEWLVPER